ncbi:hypothetical protein OG936_06135 [Streptomyces sp. NBC_00846]|uniref:hypothetical protein n=1 Tax=Streptomyces sp. NBC_00846 TaxID=2975849 RepID=UPI00386BBA6F|nr:hypothetical protein OG936_06135 [Streptomyces sp. NBC_00846]
MTKIETADVFATGRRGGGGSLYAYRVRGRGRSAVVVWIGGRGDEPDQVFAVPGAGRRHMPVFVTVRQARVYVRRRGRGLATSEAGTLELCRVQHWLEDPVRRRIPPGAVLDAWNFFEDLARGLDAVHQLPQQGTEHNSAYEKLFGGECATWTPEEQRAVLELIRAGVGLWNSCPAIVNPCSGIVLDGEPAPRAL